MNNAVPVQDTRSSGYVPLSEDHLPGLALVATEDRSAYISTMVSRAAESAAYMKAQLTRGGGLSARSSRGNAVQLNQPSVMVAG